MEQPANYVRLYMSLASKTDDYEREEQEKRDRELESQRAGLGRR